MCKRLSIRTVLYIHITYMTFLRCHLFKYMSCQFCSNSIVNIFYVYCSHMKVTLSLLKYHSILVVRSVSLTSNTVLYFYTGISTNCKQKVSLGLSNNQITMYIIVLLKFLGILHLKPCIKD